MLKQVLTEEEIQIRAEERKLLTDLLSTLAHLEADPHDEKTLKQAIEQLDKLFLLVVVGEFNSGKSAFINALLGEKVLEEGITPTTKRIHILSFGDPEYETGGRAYAQITARVELLKYVNIVDTPGTNAIHREHEAMTREFVPRSDLVLFVTSADRPFTESERAFLENIRNWGKKVVIVVNKIDILQDQKDNEEVREFVSENAQKLLGSKPEIFSVSALRAFQAKSGLSGPSTDDFASLEKYISETLDERERVRLKLLNPLGVGSNLVHKYLASISQNLELLAGDLSTLRDIEAQQEIYAQDLRREFQFRIADIKNILHEFEKRGIDFFDDRIRLGRIVDLLNRERLKADFERNVVGDVPAEIERRVEELIDWIVASELNQWQAVTTHLSRRPSRFSEQIVGEVGGRFQYDRKRLLETVGRRARLAVETYDRRREAQALADRVQMAVAGTALAEVGAIGLGTAVGLLATSTLADVTGILAASVLAVLGLFVLPARRSRAKEELRQSILNMRSQLIDALQGQFESELTSSLKRIEEGIAPYSRFVRAQNERFQKSRTELEQIQEEMEAIKIRLD